MKSARTFLRGLALMFIFMLMLPAGIGAQDSGEPDPADRFSKEELAQMLAPIALYPDSLIAQILMASTYPLEVVEAERWRRQNKDLKGDVLDNALRDKSWDPSVKSLCHYPDVLIAMSDKLDQTRKLGDAYLAQEADVMTTVQELRRRADEQGNLTTTREQTVITEQEVIRIEPTDPQMVYLPVYNPVYVYGPWWYPAYPPWYWYYPPGFIYTGGYISFGPGFFVGFGISSWCWFDWHNHYMYVDYDKTGHFHRHHDGGDSGKHYWKHDPGHRRGVAYRDRRTSDHYGQRPSRRSKADTDVRGYPSRDNGQKAVGQPKDRRERRNGMAEPGVRTQRERSQVRIDQQVRPDGQRQGSERDRVRSGAGRETPFNRVGNANFERRAAERGGESRRNSEPGYQGGNTGRQSSGPPSGSYQRGVQGGSSQGSAPSGGRQGGGQGGGFRR